MGAAGANSSALPWKMMALRAGSVTIPGGGDSRAQVRGAARAGAWRDAAGGRRLAGRRNLLPGLSPARSARILPCSTEFSTLAKLSAVVLRTP